MWGAVLRGKGKARHCSFQLYFQRTGIPLLFVRGSPAVFFFRAIRYILCDIIVAFPMLAYRREPPGPRVCLYPETR